MEIASVVIFYLVSALRYRKTCNHNKAAVVKWNKKSNNVFPAGVEPATVRVWGGRDNHYTTETTYQQPISKSIE